MIVPGPNEPALAEARKLIFLVPRPTRAKVSGAEGRVQGSPQLSSHP